MVVQAHNFLDFFGNVVLQKTKTVDYLTHKRKKNQGETHKYEVKGSHEAIISKEEFLRVQALIDKRALEFGNVPEGRNKHTQRYAFSEKIICGNCEEVFKRRTWNSKAKSK